jgi:hypothetical protein
MIANFVACYSSFSFFLETLVRTSGKQKVGVIANFVACYLVGVPLGLVLSFHYRQSILGLWWGQVISKKKIKTKKTCGVTLGLVLSLHYRQSKTWSVVRGRSFL